MDVEIVAKFLSTLPEDDDHPYRTGPWRPQTTEWRADDLTAIDGIGPAVEELCAGIGIHTWDELARTEVSLLRTMLNDAGPRFRSLDPSSWPGQAGLLAAGRPDGSRSSGESAGGDG